MFQTGRPKDKARLLAMNEVRKEALEQFAQQIFQKKKERRRQLAALSFEEKIDIVVRMQSLASDISLQMRGVCRKPWWNPDAIEGT